MGKSTINAHIFHDLNPAGEALVMSVGVAGAAITALAESETKNEETQQGHLGIGRLTWNDMEAVYHRYIGYDIQYTYIYICITVYINVIYNGNII